MKSFELPGREAKDEASLQEGMDWLFDEHARPAALVVRTDAHISPKVLRDYFKKLRA